ncbi:hypothetical protein [Comamonas sp. JC664]|uniref:hypothetical protein n=1 Tax=Comamonas sp. JC664 TaxID=2801917 RepID=UPI00174C29D8|nr:hypothetical protein [Comamonas sp. JC664]MBL0693423.1 hypothetical protein [Comamonas sp. JC664]GHG72426.1 hypothetical protein GCM10012319_18380 [Comamonas sp. KCTC 72670]
MSRSTHRQPVSPVRSRRMALPLALLCALAYMGSVMHFALVQHATCLEHGEVIHVEAGSDHGAGHVEASFDDVRLASRGAQAESHGTDAHCVHAFFRREAPPPQQDAPSLLAAPVLSQPALAVFRFHSEPVARLHLAPKASPPRA